MLLLSVRHPAAFTPEEQFAFVRQLEEYVRLEVSLAQNQGSNAAEMYSTFDSIRLALPQLLPTMTNGPQPGASDAETPVA